MGENKIEMFNNIVLFDSHCAFCDKMIFKLNENDKNNFLKYGFLSDYKQFNESLGLHIQYTNALVFIKSGREVYYGCKAISEILITINKFKICSSLINSFPYLSSLIYKIIAKNRSRFFKKQCHYSKNLKSKIIRLVD